MSVLVHEVAEAILTVLGGSTPFSVGLFDAIAMRSEGLPVMQVRLHGRDVAALQLVSAYGAARLAETGWEVSWTTQLEQALEGADVVLHQVRYGGLELRDEGERLAAVLGVQADETLGPAGLLTAILMVSPIRDLVTALDRYSPAAVVLNLTNPLSCSTYLFQHGSARTVLGLCELPLTTMHAACTVLSIPPEEVEWAYTGLNHRGFVHRLAYADRDYLPELADRLGRSAIAGVTAEEVGRLGVLPLKYFELTRPYDANRAFDTNRVFETRAAFLARLRAKIIQELRDNSVASPAALCERDPNWYRLAVVPTMAAMVSQTPERLMVNVAGDDGVVREGLADVSVEGVVPTIMPPLPEAAAQWIQRFEAHERAALEATMDPTSASITAALEQDPSVPHDRVAACARMLGDLLSRRI